MYLVKEFVGVSAAYLDEVMRESTDSVFYRVGEKTGTSLARTQQRECGKDLGCYLSVLKKSGLIDDFEVKTENERTLVTVKDRDVASSADMRSLVRGFLAGITHGIGKAYEISAKMEGDKCVFTLTTKK